jgi:hypothetical protein
MKFTKILFTLGALSFAGGTNSAPTGEKIQQPGNSLTAWGAEKAGNKDGTIPEYTGGVKNPPKVDYYSGTLPDPFADDTIQFSIDGKSVDKYSDKLSAGTVAMLKKYPTFRVDVYPTHRSVSYPQAVLDNTIKNATRCSTKDGGETLDVSKGCRDGFPFPVPKTGYEVLWNRNANYYGGQIIATNSSRFVKPSGEAVTTNLSITYEQDGLYDPDKKTVDMHYMNRTEFLGPTRLTGQTNLVYDRLDNERKAWSYQPSTRRTRLAPDFAADTPVAATGGAFVYDEITMFSGAMDRFDFKLIGKKEMYIPYNNYRTFKECNGDGGKMFAPLHPNPECVRWELHRVWHVHADLKPGKRHIYKTRDFYFDEDAWSGGVADEYDHNDQIYRVVLAAQKPDYAQNAPGHPDYFAIDLISGSWGWLDSPRVWILDKPIPAAMNPETASTHMLRIPTK